MAIANQGYRRDLNLDETTNDTLALDNLAGAGTADDLSYLQNNLRNSSSVSFNSVDPEGFFSFANDREIDIDSIESKGDVDEDNNPINRTSVSINLTNPYIIKFGDLIDISGITGDATAEQFNGQHSVTAVSSDLKRVTFIKSGLHYSNTNIPGSNKSFKLKAQNVFAFTNGDVINVDEDVKFQNGTVTSGINVLSKGVNYYVIESNGVNKFKLSETPNGNTVDGRLVFMTANQRLIPNNFIFKRQDGVHQEQIINFIKPEIQDTEDFSYADDINGVFESTQSNIEGAEFFSLKKYRADQDSTTSESIKIEGSVTLHDSDNYNSSSSNVLGSSKAPGIYIGDTRAFSSDNNPWDESIDEDGGSTSKLTTESEEVSIGELAFLDGSPLSINDYGSMTIIGIDSDVSNASGVVASSFTHKLPIRVQDSSGNKETYYLLLTEN